MNGERLLQSLDALAQVGAIEGGGCSRLAFTPEDAAGRARVVQWMVEAGLQVRVDAAGNTVGRRAGRTDGPAVMTGSHIDTVRTGGRYDGTLGVLAGLELVRTLNERGVTTRRPLEVAFFSNEEGARFPPDMMGSLMYVGALAHDELVPRVRELLPDFAGPAPVPGPAPYAFVELHIEQGPVLEAEGLDIGVVTGVQGISWHRVVYEGVSNHAGTAPMRLRDDAGRKAMTLAAHVHGLASGDAVATVGSMRLSPNLINVVPNRAEMTVDLRSPDAEQLRAMEAAFLGALHDANHENLVRLEPMVFDPDVVDRIERAAQRRGLKQRRMVSGAGHDAQMLSRVCPAAMVFVPSVGGISHNVREHTMPEHLIAGAEVLADVLLELSDVE